MKVYDKFTVRYMKNNVYGRYYHIPPKKVFNRMVLPSADRTVRLENFNGNEVITIRVSYWDYRNDSNILDYIRAECSMINENRKACREKLLAVLSLTVTRIRYVMLKIIDWCDVYVDYAGSVVIVYISLSATDCMICLKSDESIFEYMETCDLNKLSNRPLVEFLIDYLSSYAERLEYYEQEIAKSKN